MSSEAGTPRIARGVPVCLRRLNRGWSLRSSPATVCYTANVPFIVRAAMSRSVLPAWGIAAVGAALFAAPCVAQTDTPLVLSAPPSPLGEPLPPFNVRYSRVETTLPATDTGIGAPRLVVFSGDVRLEWGDVTLRAKRLVYDAAKAQFDGTGDIVLTRGIETVRGDSITFFTDTGAFAVQNGVVVSPPYSIAGMRVERDDTGLRVAEATLAPDVGAKGELRLLAREVNYVEGTYTELKDVRVYLYGQRVLTLPRYRILRRYGPRKSDIPAIPLRFKFTRISGLALGLGNTWTLTRNANADAAVFLPTKNGLQYALSATYSFVGTETDAPPFLNRVKRDSMFNAAGAKKKKNAPVDPAEPSALRRFLTVVPSPGVDPLLDFQPILGTPESVGEPLQQSPRFASLTGTYSGREEVGLKRQGNLLLDRRGEARFLATLPLNHASPNGGKPFETNAALREYLRSPRLALIADLSTGNYTEQRVTNATGTQGSISETSAGRTGGEVGIMVLPLLLGKNVLLRGQTSYRLFDYGNGLTYRVPEVGVAASYIFDRHTQIGGALYRREPTGRTPFFFDQIDTRSEAQGLVQGRITNRVTAAFLVRYDIEQSRLFDYGVTVDYRGTSLAPRLGYRKLGGQFSVGFNLVGL